LNPELISDFERPGKVIDLFRFSLRIINRQNWINRVEETATDQETNDPQSVICKEQDMIANLLLIKEMLLYSKDL
jgi:hypothetical protein